MVATPVVTVCDSQQRIILGLAFITLLTPRRTRHGADLTAFTTLHLTLWTRHIALRDTRFTTPFALQPRHETRSRTGVSHSAIVTLLKPSAIAKNAKQTIRLFIKNSPSKKIISELFDHRMTNRKLKLCEGERKLPPEYKLAKGL